jgi:hypothetical protein
MKRETQLQNITHSEPVIVKYRASVPQFLTSLSGMKIASTSRLIMVHYLWFVQLCHIVTIYLAAETLYYVLIFSAYSFETFRSPSGV